MPEFVQAAIGMADEFFLHKLMLFRNGAGGAGTEQSVDANPTCRLCANGQCRNVSRRTQQLCPRAMCKGVACNLCEYPSCEKCKMRFRSRGGKTMYAVGHCTFLSAAKRRPFLARGESGAAPEPSYAGNSTRRLHRPSGSLAMKGILSIYWPGGSWPPGRRTPLKQLEPAHRMDPTHGTGLQGQRGALVAVGIEKTAGGSQY